MCLHACADQSQRIAGELTTGAGHGATSQEDEDAWVGAVGAVLLQVAVLQCLRRKESNYITSFGHSQCVTSLSHVFGAGLHWSKLGG